MRGCKETFRSARSHAAPRQMDQARAGARYGRLGFPLRLRLRQPGAAGFRAADPRLRAREARRHGPHGHHGAAARDSDAGFGERERSATRATRRPRAKHRFLRRAAPRTVIYPAQWPMPEVWSSLKEKSPFQTRRQMHRFEPLRLDEHQDNRVLLPILAQPVGIDCTWPMRRKLSMRDWRCRSTPRVLEF